MHTNAPKVPTDASTNKHAPAQSAPAQHEQPPKKGKDKKIWSCHSCRRRKLKCDRSDPCGACQARGEGNSCTWEEGQRPEKNNRESLEQLPSLIQKLTQEVKELKASNAELVHNFQHKEGIAPLESRSTTFRKSQDVSPMIGRSATSSLNSVSSPPRLPRGPFLTMCSALPQGSDISHQSPDRQRWAQSQIVALLPESNLLWGLLCHFDALTWRQFHVSASLTGFIDIPQLLSELEEVEHVRRGTENRSSTVSVEYLDIKVSLILACASLAATNLDAGKAEELGIRRLNIDAFARELWRKARMLITPVESDSFSTGSEPSMPRAHPSLADPHMNACQTGLTSSCPPVTLLKIVAIKIILLLAARSFAGSSEYLKLHLDTISSAVEASLDSPCDDDVSFEEREWRWQLWSSLCVLDWTSPGIYHNGSYFIRPEMHFDPPSKVPGLPDDGTYSPLMEMEHLERLGQTRYFLEYALALASLSCRAEDCTVRPGPVLPGQAADLCSELDDLDHKLNFYHQFSGGGGRGGGGGGGGGGGRGGGPTGYPKSIVNGSAGERGGQVGNNSSYNANDHRLSNQTALQVQLVHLNLMLGLTRFKICRHEAFQLMQDSTSSPSLRTMCMDTCMDACILVLSQCRNIGVRTPQIISKGGEGMRSTITNSGEKYPYPGIFRRVIQPASSAALVGQVLLHASRSSEGNGLIKMQDKQPVTIKDNSNNHQNSTSQSAPASGNAVNKEYYKSYAEPYVMEGFGLQSPWNGNGNGGPDTQSAAAASTAGVFGREKLGLLQLHINAVVGELETLQTTSPLAMHKLLLHRQCM